MGVVYLNNAGQVGANQPTAGGVYQLGAAQTDARTFAAAGLLTGQQSEFRARNSTGAGPWELFLGTYATGAPDTLTRAVVRASSTGAAIDWSAAGVTPVIDAVAVAAEEPLHEYPVTGTPVTVEVVLEPGAANYRFHFRHLHVSTNGATLVGQVYEGGAWVGSSGDYAYATYGRHTDLGWDLFSTATGNALAITNNQGNQTDKHASGLILIHSARDASRPTHFRWIATFGQSQATRFGGWTAHGFRRAAGLSERFRLVVDTGTIDGGFYGIQRSARVPGV